MKNPKPAVKGFGVEGWGGELRVSAQVFRLREYSP